VQRGEKFKEHTLLKKDERGEGEEGGTFQVVKKGLAQSSESKQGSRSKSGTVKPYRVGRGGRKLKTTGDGRGGSGEGVKKE